MACNSPDAQPASNSTITLKSFPAPGDLPLAANCLLPGRVGRTRPGPVLAQSCRWPCGCSRPGIGHERVAEDLTHVAADHIPTLRISITVEPSYVVRTNERRLHRCS